MRLNGVIYRPCSVRVCASMVPPHVDVSVIDIPTHPRELVGVARQVSFIKIPVNLNIPISISPAVSKGHLALTFGPSTTPPASAKVTVKGTVKLNDASSSEILCLAIDAE
jgi:hypothetical protein